uniref:Uncharacterized protein n=1 Tax=Staphylococcus phage UHP46 TaxID=3234966 RepID=A0AB39C8D8_9CAUD
MKNVEELLSIITKGMSEKDIELTHVDLYEQAVSINNKVKVCLASEYFLVCNLCSGGGITYYSNDSMLNRVLELLTEKDWLPGDDIENDLESCTLVVEDDCYRLLYNDYSISDRMTLEDLRKKYTNVSLEKRMKQ